MKLSKTLTLIFLFIISLNSLEGRIIQTDNMSDILKEVDENTIVFFDIDDTLVYVPTMMGNSHWWNYCREVCSNNNWDNVKFSFQLMPNLHQAYKMVKTGLVDKTAPELINTLKEQGVLVFGLTARSRKISGNLKFDASTSDELASLGVTFCSADVEMQSYYGGIIFTSTNLKGPYVERFLKQYKGKIKKVIFIDDNWKQINSVDSQLALMKVHNVCFRYSKMDHEHENFDPLIANIQLKGVLESQTLFSNEEALEILDHLTITDPHFYLRYLYENLAGVTP